MALLCMVLGVAMIATGCGDDDDEPASNGGGDGDGDGDGDGNGGGGGGGGTGLTADSAECQDLIDQATEASTQAGPCIQSCIEGITSCIVDNGCTSLPAECIQTYTTCITDCISTQ